MDRFILKKVKKMQHGHAFNIYQLSMTEFLPYGDIEFDEYASLKTLLATLDDTESGFFCRSRF